MPPAAIPHLLLLLLLLLSGSRAAQTNASRTTDVQQLRSSIERALSDMYGGAPPRQPDSAAPAGGPIQQPATSAATPSPAHGSRADHNASHIIQAARSGQGSRDDVTSTRRPPTGRSEEAGLDATATATDGATDRAAADLTPQAAGYGGGVGNHTAPARTGISPEGMGSAPTRDESSHSVTAAVSNVTDSRESKHSTETQIYNNSSHKMIADGGVDMRPIYKDKPVSPGSITAPETSLALNLTDSSFNSAVGSQSAVTANTASDTPDAEPETQPHHQPTARHPTTSTRNSNSTNEHSSGNSGPQQGNMTTRPQSRNMTTGFLPRYRTTGPLPKNRITGPLPKNMTASTQPRNRTTSPLSRNRTTRPQSRNMTTGPLPRNRTTSLQPRNMTTSTQQRNRTTIPLSRNRTTSSQPRNRTTRPQPRNRTTSPQPRNSANRTQPRNRTTTPQPIIRTTLLQQGIRITRPQSRNMTTGPLPRNRTTGPLPRNRATGPLAKNGITGPLPRNRTTGPLPSIQTVPANSSGKPAAKASSATVRYLRRLADNASGEEALSHLPVPPTQTDTTSPGQNRIGTYTQGITTEQHTDTTVESENASQQTAQSQTWQTTEADSSIPEDDATSDTSQSTNSSATSTIHTNETLSNSPHINKNLAFQNESYIGLQLNDKRTSQEGSSIFRDKNRNRKTSDESYNVRHTIYKNGTLSDQNHTVLRPNDKNGTSPDEYRSVEHQNISKASSDGHYTTSVADTTIVTFPQINTTQKNGTQAALANRSTFVTSKQNTAPATNRIRTSHDTVTDETSGYNNTLSVTADGTDQTGAETIAYANKGLSDVYKRAIYKSLSSVTNIVHEHNHNKTNAKDIVTTLMATKNRTSPFDKASFGTVGQIFENNRTMPLAANANPNRSETATSRGPASSDHYRNGTANPTDAARRPRLPEDVEIIPASIPHSATTYEYPGDRTGTYHNQQGGMPGSMVPGTAKPGSCDERTNVCHVNWEGLYYTEFASRISLNEIRTPLEELSTDTHSCTHVRSVPESERRKLSLSTFYQRYTEAYGIPVLSSSAVPDAALRRACYITRFLFADHQSLRDSYRQRRGRIAVIGLNERTTQIPEHRSLGAAWDKRARGLGATDHAPVCTIGEENLLRYGYPSDRWYTEDIGVHEFSHGLHLLAAKYTWPKWTKRLITAFKMARLRGLWRNTYAGTNYMEYFAEGVQKYFNVEAFSQYPNGIHNHVDTNEKLLRYDPKLHELIEELFPCRNKYISRRTSNFKSASDKQKLRLSFPNCLSEDVMASTAQVEEGTPTTAVPATTNGKPPAPLTPPRPSVIIKSRKKSRCSDKDENCRYWARSGYCYTNAIYMTKSCREACGLCGGCRDTNPTCAEWAEKGECRRNPSYMLYNCRTSCGDCSNSEKSGNLDTIER